jgi:hypothetical protein
MNARLAACAYRQGQIPDACPLVGLHGLSEDSRQSVESHARRRRIPPCGCIDLEAIAGEARDDVEVGVEDLLTRGLTVGHEEVDAIGADRVNLAEVPRQATGDGEQPIGCGIGQVVGVDGVLVRDNQQVTGRDRADVEENSFMPAARPTRPAALGSAWR